MVAAYNFRRPDRISKEQLRSLHFLHDRFAHNVSTSLSAFLRSVTEVTIVSVEQFAYSEFLMSLPEQTAFYAVSLDPLDGVAAVELNPAVAFTMVDRLLGGTGENAGLVASAHRDRAERHRLGHQAAARRALGRVARGHRSQLPHPGP